MLSINNETHGMSMIVKDSGAFVVRLTNYLLDEGDEVVFTIAANKEDETPAVQKRITTFVDNNAAVINLTTNDTDVPVGNYWYDIQVNSADGRVDTIVGPYKFKFLGGATY